jgi:hypothetical protein
MNITQVTVKTFYDIEITFDDFLRAFIRYGAPEGDTDRIMYPKAFEGYDLENHTTGYVMQVMQKISVFGHGDFAAYMARFFQFDGWANMGYYHKPSERYRMTVFHYGNYIRGGLTT